MAGLFDDLIPGQPAGAPAPGGAPAPAGAAPGGGLFDDLIPATPTSAATSSVPPLADEFGRPMGTEATNAALEKDDALGNLVAAGDGFASSIPFTDRAAAGAAALTGLGGKFGDYSGNLAQLRKEEGAAVAAHPGLDKAGAVAGGAVLALATGGGSLAAEVGETAPAAVSAAAPVVQSFGRKVASGMLGGAGFGAAQGASSSSDLTNPWETAKDTAIGAGAGAALGGTISALAHGAGTLFRSRGSDAVPTVQGVSPAARDVMLGAIDKDGAANVQRNADLYGDPAMMFDYGTGLRGVAEGLATKDGPAASTIGDALGYRQAATNSRVRTGLMQNFGPAEDPSAVKAAIGDVQDAATGPLFARAEAAGVPWDADSAALMGRPAVGRAMRGAAQDAANAGTPFPTVVLDEAGNPVASDAATQAYEAGQRPAVTSALADMLGADPARGPLSLEDALLAQRQAEAGPAYAAYRSMDVPMTPELQQVLQRPSVQAALPAAERKAADQGRSIYASPANTPAPSATPSGAGSTEIPDITAGLGQGPGATMGRGSTLNTPAASPSWAGAIGNTAPPRPTGPAPVSLVSALQRAGGIDPAGGDAVSMGLNRFPGLIRQGGMSLDRAREMAAEAGYLGADTARAVRETGPNDLLDALGNHPTYSVHDQDAVAARQAYADYQAGRGAPTSHDLAREAVRSHLLDSGVPANSIDPATLDVAAHLHGRGMDPGDAWEAAATAPPFPGDMPAAPGGAGAAGAGGQAPPMRQLTPEGLDYVKRALDDRIAGAQRGSDPSPDDARIFGGLKSDLLGAIERHPDPAIADAYGAARQAYAAPSREIDALHAGRAAFGDNVTPEQVQREFAALGTDGERQQYRNGMFAAGSEKLSRAGDTSNFVRTVSGSQVLRDKFLAVVPHQDALDRFNGHIARAGATFTEAQRPTAGAWRAALERLDGMAAKGDAGAGAARDALAAHLGINPDFARARGIQADYEGLKGAVDYGRESLAAGGDPVWPQGFAQRFAAMTPAEQAAVRTGQRSLMEEAVGVKPNDQLAIKGLFQTGNTPGYTAPGVTPGAPDLSGWNAQKLAAAYGHEPVANMQELLNANDAFNATFNGVANNSKTARRNAMMESLKDQEWQPRDLMKEGHGDDTLLGLGRTVLAKGVNTVAHAFQHAPSNAIRDADLARVGTLTGGERVSMLADLLDALPAYQQREAAVNASREQMEMWLHALAGGGGVAALDPMRHQAALAEELAQPARARQ